MELLDFINNNNDWREKLAVSPYNLTIENEPPYVIINATPASNFNFKLVREANNAQFYFENNRAILAAAAIDHPCAPTLDWNSVQTYQLVEGKQVVVWNNNGIWHGVPPVASWLFENLSPEYIYTFMMTGDDVDTIADYGKERLYWFVGMRNARTGNEELKTPNFNSKVRLPHSFPRLQSQNLVEALLHSTSKDEVGFVCVDKNGDRRAFYGDAWWRINHKRNLSSIDIVELWKNNDLDVKSGYIDLILGLLQRIMRKENVTEEELKKYPTVQLLKMVEEEIMGGRKWKKS